jgi:hypothetical protein
MTAPVSVAPRQDQRPPVRQDQASRRRPRRPHVTLRPCGVVAIWATLLGALAATSAGFGNNALVLEISGSAAGFVLLLAGIVRLDRRLHPARSYLRQPTRVGGVVMLAVAIALGWLGTAFGAWLMIIAAVPLLAAIGLEILARRQRAGVWADPAPAVTRPARGRQRGDGADQRGAAGSGTAAPLPGKDSRPVHSGTSR